MDDSVLVIILHLEILFPTGYRDHKRYTSDKLSGFLIDKLYFDNIKLKSLIGIKDASTTAQFVAFLNVFCQIAKNRIVYKNHDICINYENNADFLKKTIIFDFGIKVYFTIFDLIFAIILSFYKRSKYVKKRKKSK